MRCKIYTLFAIVLFFISTVSPTFAQSTQLATESAMSTQSATQKEITKTEQKDLTKPEEEKAKKEFLALFLKRPISEPGFTNFMGYSVQYAVRNGVPANTIILILLIPFLATLSVIARNIIGVPTLEMLVPIALAITFVATGPVAGVILLGTILFASTIARMILKKIRIMQLPKMAISMLIVSGCVFVVLILSSSFSILSVTQLSFLPVLLLILLSDKIVALQLSRGTKPAVIITLFTLVLGSIGYFILSSGFIRSYVLLYPEIVLILVPINILLGRYFGLRLTEYYRFSQLRRYANK